jgi:transcriptional regulator with XRE-family HTH domain
MKTSFGTRLRTQRERKGISLVEISRHTKIKVSLLEALERDDLSYWPHGLFGRAYFRAYAQAAGIDAEPLIPEFLERHPDPPDELFNAAAIASRSNFSALRSAVRSLPGLRRREEKADTPPELETLATICRRLQQAQGPDDLDPILATVARTLNASGLMVWRWGPDGCGLKPWLSHGYPEQMVAQLPRVKRDDENAIAAAVRSMQVCTVAKGDHETGALVVPLVASGRCVGALSLELRSDVSTHEFVGHAALIVAALLASSHCATFTPFTSSHRASDDSPMNDGTRIAGRS